MTDTISIDEGRIIKMEVDYSSTCDEKIPEYKQQAKTNLKGSIENLLALEKQTRTGADAGSTGRILVAIVQVCFEANDWDTLCEHIVILTKRRSQLKHAVTKMIQECCTYVSKAPNKEIKLKLIDTLRQVTEGKIYVEIERARLTLELAKMREAEGDINKAADIIQELQVETYGTMEKREKVELILEQMRLCLAKNDYVRTQIISKKINTKFFDDNADSIELKLKYYNLMMKLDQHEGAHLSTCKHYRAIQNCQPTREARLNILRNAVLYLILASHDNEQSDLTHRIMSEKELDEIPECKELLKLFVNPELIKWSCLCQLYEKKLLETEVFGKNEEGQKRWKELKNRVVEHNISVMAQYYTRIRLSRMAELLNLTETETEDALSNLVVNGTVHAKTDRPAGVVYFTKSQDPSDVLNDWARHLSKLMDLVNKTTHLINKEQCVHKHLLAVKE